MPAVIEIISLLEKVTITKELLEVIFYLFLLNFKDQNNACLYILLL